MPLVLVVHSLALPQKKVKQKHCLVTFRQALKGAPTNPKPLLKTVRKFVTGQYPYIDQTLSQWPLRNTVFLLQRDFLAYPKTTSDLLLS